jgi:capsular exopolysaccharide synthesis family protein
MSFLTPSDPDPRANVPASRGRGSAPPPGPVWGEPEPQDSGPSDEIELTELLGILKRRWLLVLSLTSLCVSAAAALIWFDEPSYQSSAVLRLEDQRGSMTGALDPLAERALGRRTDPLQTELQVIRSTSVIGLVVDREGLRFTPTGRGFHLGLFENVEVAPIAAPDTLILTFDPAEFQVRIGGQSETYVYGEDVILPGVRFRIDTRPGVESGVVVVLPRQRAISELRDAVTVRARNETNIVDVTVTARDPYVAERVTNALVEEFRSYNTRLARQDAERRRIFIEERLDQADSILLEAQNTLSEFRSREGVFSSQDWFAAQQAGLLNVEMRREELDASRSQYRTMLSGLETAEVGEVTGRLQAIVASPGIAQNPIILELFDRLSRYEIQYDSLTTGPWRASASNPDVQRLAQNIAATTQSLENAVRSHLRQLDAQVAAMDDLRGRTQREIAALPTVEAEESRLVQSVVSLSRTVDQLREEYQRSLIAEAVEVGQVEVVDWASFPLTPLSSRASLKLALGLLLGLMLGGGSAFVAESLNKKIRQQTELERLLGIPSVGTIPQLPGAGNAPLNRVRGLIGGGGSRSQKTARAANDLLLLTDAQSPQAEAYRTIRTNILFSDSVTKVQTLVVTSPTPGEGKSTTAANLAVAYAQQGLKVLLVDCDLRKARLHHVFGESRDPGLTDFLLGRAEWSEVRRDTAQEGMDFLPAGSIPPNPSELLGGSRMRGAIQAFRDGYEMVIFDTPPLIAGADAALLGSLCDGVILIIRAGQTEREPAQQALRQLYTVGARVLGSVLNDPDGEMPRYSSYYAYQYKYYGEAS